MIHIEYDDAKVPIASAKALAIGTQEIVSCLTAIEDVFVYANTAQIKIKVAPVEIFVRMSDYKIPDEDKLLQDMKRELAQWKEENGFTQTINLARIPMHWKIETGI